jgi:hypothetical protein
VDRAIARIAMRQHGVITAPQLAALGVDASAIEYRIRIGRLVRLHRGVYAVAYLRNHRETLFLAAVLPCGPGALLSYQAAGALWGLTRRQAGSAVDVTVPGRNVRSRPGIRVHRVAGFDPNCIDEEAGIPVTSPAFTLLDLAVVLPPDRLLRAVNQGLVQNLTTESQLLSLVARRSRRAGTQRLREVLLGVGIGPTRSDLEDAGLRLVAEHGLPAAVPNHHTWAGGRDREIDLAWPAHRLAVELDSKRYHGNPAAQAIDREKAAALRTAGWRVLRFSWTDVFVHPGRTARRLRAALDATTVSRSPE